MNVAGAMGMTPTSGPFRMITGAAVAYGLTSGAAQAPEIGITPLGMRVVRPTTEGDDIAAKREALLLPNVIGEFLRDDDGAALPSDAIARNVLQERGYRPNDWTQSWGCHRRGQDGRLHSRVGRQTLRRSRSRLDR